MDVPESSSQFVTTAFFGATAALAFLIYQWNSSRRKRLLPLAPAGLLDTISATSGSEAPFFLLRMAQTLGCNDFRLNLPISAIVAGGYELQREIFEDKTTDKPLEMFKGFETSLSGPSLFTVNNETAAVTRKKISPAFSSKYVKRMNQVCMEYVEQWIEETLKPTVEKGGSFDPSKEMAFLTFLIICKAAFDYEATNEEAEEFLAHEEIVSKEFGFRQVFNPFRAYLTFLLPERQKAFASARWTQNYALKMLRSFRSKRENTQGTVISLIDSDERYKSDNQKIPEILVWLFAGHNTTGSSLATTLLHLAQNPQEMTKLRNSLAATPKEKWHTVDQVVHVVNESNRLVPAGALGSVRRTGRDFLTKDGYVIPKGTVAFLPQYIQNHDPLLYPDPESFQPSRWEKESKYMKEAHMPFARGSRSCPGMALARAELHSVIPRLISEFDFEVVEEGKVEFFIILRPKGVVLKATRVHK